MAKMRVETPVLSDDIRIGQLLVNIGCISEEQLKETLREQIRREHSGIHRAVSEICVESHWCTMKDIAIAVKEQEEDSFRLSTLGQILLNLGFVGPEELGRALAVHSDSSARIGETLVELHYCTDEQIKIAMELQILYRNGMLRQSIVSRYHPYNVMELVVNYQIDNAIVEHDGCFCQECRANVFANAMNHLPPQYITDEREILPLVEQYRNKHADLITQVLNDAVTYARQHQQDMCPGMQPQQLALQRMPAAGVSSQHVPVRISNHHVHLCAEHVATLFGEAYTLTPWKPLRQPGRYAAEEVVTLVGPKGQIENVRVIGPVRSVTQVEICGTDQYVLGIQAPVRDPGNFDGTPGMTIRGPHGDAHLVRGVIRTLRHIHLSLKDLRQLHLSADDVVNVRLNGDRNTVYEGVLIRLSPSAVLEMHIDTDEANMAGIPSQSVAEILGPSFR